MVAEHRGRYVSRRQFVQGAGVAGFGLLAGCGRPLQRSETGRVPRIGIVALNPPDAADVDAFHHHLRELGYVAGQSILIEYRSADGQDARYPALVTELLGLPVDLIVARGLAVARAARAVTSTVPIVFTGVSDPVGSGLVASLARPGGNITGLSAFTTELSGKRVQLLKDTLPEIARVAVLAAHTTSPTQVRETENAARALGLQLQLLEARGPDEVGPALDAAAMAQAEALVVLLGAPLVASAAQIAELSITRRLPSIAPDRRFTEAGGFLSYGPDLAEIERRAASYVDKLLKGASPADLPVEQPRELDFVINLKTAQALGLTIPQHVLLQATEIIQ
jgi:putative tryptophan/tyrosine transport system substrate-binding protein